MLSALPPEPGSDPASPLTGRGTLLSALEMFDRVRESAVDWTAALLQMVAALLLVIPSRSSTCALALGSNTTTRWCRQ